MRVRVIIADACRACVRVFLGCVSVESDRTRVPNRLTGTLTEIRVAVCKFPIPRFCDLILNGKPTRFTRYAEIQATLFNHYANYQWRVETLHQNSIF